MQRYNVVKLASLAVALSVCLANAQTNEAARYPSVNYTDATGWYAMGGFDVVRRSRIDPAGGGQRAQFVVGKDCASVVGVAQLEPVQRLGPE
ncbi:hypothetical protein ACVINI_003179 [Rhizobium beringeri]